MQDSGGGAEALPACSLVSVSIVTLERWVLVPGRRRSRDRAGPAVGKEDQADRAISKAQLRTLLRFHMPPIDVVVYDGSYGETWS